jgi:glycosyltransferase involved in cell wall biosynthesis/SAM-dependent methyltransferase
MRILHTEASCGWGGQEIRILEEAKGLIARGHEVTLACPSTARIYAEAPHYGVPVVAVPIARKNLSGLFALRRHLTRLRPDVVNTHSSTDSWLTALACVTIRHGPPIVRTRHISAPVPKNAASRWLYSGALCHVVTAGEALRQQLIEGSGAVPERVTSVPTGIDTIRFSPGDKRAARHALGLDPDGRIIGIVATLRSWKGHLYLLEAFAKLVRSDATLLIIGEGPMRGPIESKIAELQLTNRVRLVGQQDNPEDWLRSLDIFCLPSYANEGVPQAILQAMMTGVPIVTTPVGAILEAVNDGETALVVPPKDAFALAGAIDRLMQDPRLASRLGHAARDRALERFSREAMLDRMESVFRNALGKAEMDFDWTRISDDPNNRAAKAEVRILLPLLRKVHTDTDLTGFVERAVAGKRVLDIGVISHSARYFDEPGWRHGRIHKAAGYCLGLDILEPLVAELNGRGFNVRCVDATSELDLGERFDTVFIGDVMEHVDNPSALLRFARRHLTTGGRIFAATPNPFSRKFVRQFFRQGVVVVNLDHMAWFTPTMALEISRRVGLRLTAYHLVKPIGGISGVLKKLAWCLGVSPIEYSFPDYLFEFSPREE